jgi:hypothetical protein
MPDPVGGDGSPPSVRPNDADSNNAGDLLASEIALIEEFSVLAVLPSFMKTQSKFRETVKEE